MSKQYSLILIGLILIPITALAAVVNLDEREERFQERLCERVVRRFADNERMWLRINKRIERRFGYQCTKSDEPVQSDEPVKSDEPVQSKELAQVINVVATSITKIEVELDMHIPADTNFNLNSFSVTVFPNSNESELENKTFSIKEIKIHSWDDRNSVIEIILNEAMPPAKKIKLHNKNYSDISHILQPITIDSSFWHTMTEDLSISYGTLEVSESDSNPKGEITVAQGAQSILMLALDITTSCNDDSFIETITLEHAGGVSTGSGSTGTGHIRDIDGMYLEYDKQIITDISRARNDKNWIDFRLNETIEIPACETISLTAKANISSEAKIGDSHRFSFALKSDVISSAIEVTGNLPIEGGIILIEK